jgi:hypothetical protein
MQRAQGAGGVRGSELMRTVGVAVAGVVLFDRAGCRMRQTMLT